MNRLRLFVALGCVLCLASTLIACAEPLDRVPMNEFTPEEKQSAETRLKDMMWKQFSDKAFYSNFCKMVTISISQSFGDPSKNPDASKQCSDGVARCEASFTNNLDKSKAEFDKQKMDFSGCKARFSEMVMCFNKSYDLIRAEGGSVSCDNTSGWSRLKDYDMNEKLGNCEELMKGCSMTPTPGIGTSTTNPSPEPGPQP